MVDQDAFDPHLPESAEFRLIRRACRKIAPLWPLKHFVAVNPFLGFSGQGFAATCSTIQRVTGANLLMPRNFYREALASGSISDRRVARLSSSCRFSSSTTASTSSSAD